MIRLVARERQIARLHTAVLGLLLLFALAAVAATDLDTGQGVMVNNVWIDVPLTQVFRDISIETGVVIATCPHVPDPLISLDAGIGKPLRECLEELVAGRGLFIYQKNEKFYLINCGSPTCPSSLEIAGSKRLCLKYITAKHLRSSLPRSVQQYVSSGERRNEVLVYAAPEITKHIMEIVNKLDVPRPQVVLEVLVVDFWEEASEEFGLNWDFSRPHTSVSMEHGIGAFTGIARYTSIPGTQFTELLFTLRALVAENRASIRSRPRVATLDGEKATIDISLNEYFTIITNYYGPSLRTELQQIKSGVLLEMTPHIGDNGDITVDVRTEVSDVASRQNQVAGNESGDLPIIRCRKADTRVRVKQGDAIVIAGLVETQEQRKEKRVPLLSSIPLVGGIFRTTDNTIVKKEVMIFITPRLMKEGEIALSDRHNLINTKEELDSLQDEEALAEPDVQHQHGDISISVEEEIQCLREVVAMLDGQHQHRRLGPPELDMDGEGQIAPSSRRDSLNVAEELDALGEVVNLLDTGKADESSGAEFP